MSVRQRVWEIVEVAKPGDRASRAFDISILSLIFLNVVAVVIGSVQHIQDRYSAQLDENAAQPKVFSSIPATMWWAVATLTTVGYGDIYSVTLAGKISASIIAILGIGMFALPTGILGAGFVEAIQERNRARVCPHCGKEIP